MHLTELGLVDYRSYSTCSLRLTPGVSLFVGSNGHGKTNLVEAVSVLSTLSSHRVSQDLPLVRAGAEQALVHAVVRRGDRQVTIDLEINPGRSNRARLAGGKAVPARHILGALKTVMFAPEDLGLVRGDPSERRRFLDELLTQRSPRVAGLRSEYDRVVRQRTALLKTARGGRRLEADLVAVWDQQLVLLGSEIMARRLHLVAELGPIVSDAYACISASSSPCTITYGSASIMAAVVADADTTGPMTAAPLCATSLEKHLEVRREDEHERGMTLVGPHRDDVVLTIGSLSAKLHASHGESWSVALALRLASLRLFRVDEDDPVLILDDVFAELDTARRDRLVTLIEGTEQVLVTVAVEGDVPRGLQGAVFEVTTDKVTARG